MEDGLGPHSRRTRRGRVMVEVQAHRGLSAEYAENTTAAIVAAAKHGFRVIELDLRRSHDKEIIVIHDADLARTTDGAGRVADMDYDEIREYDTGEGPVPRFEDVLSALDDWDGRWNVEIKDQQATTGALSILDHHGLLDRCQISSTDPRALATVAKHHPEVVRGLIVLGKPDQDDIDMAQDVGCAWMNCDHDFLDAATVERLQGEGFRIGAWTVNDVARATALVDLGVEAIITDVRAVHDAF